MGGEALTMESRFLLSARTAAEIVNADLRGDTRGGSALRVICQMILHYRLVESPELIADFLIEGEPVGDVRWGTLLATAIRWESKRRRIEPPSWTDMPPLDVEWLPGSTDPSPEFVELIRKNAEPEFLDRRILIRERDFSKL